jgi:multiple sugar transport system substrate-binding protein
MANPITLTGITWNHTRGYLPMVATAQRFSELHPDIEIVWHKRSLQEFADYPIERLVERFDLLVLDHPFAGQAAAQNVLLPLDEHLSPEFLCEQATGSVGQSHPSYTFSGHQWALAIDAATPVSSYRPDLLEKYELELPGTWEALLDLARQGWVALPAIAVDSLMNYYMLCIALGAEPFTEEGGVVSRDIGVAALEHLRELVNLCAPACLKRNPIATYEVMTTTDDVVYCPFAYGYSNYARPSYARSELRFGGLVSFAGQRLRSTLGGTGLAISSHCRHVEHAVEYACFVAQPSCQRGLFFTSGGQPGHRSAWEDAQVNATSNNFFKDTLQTLDEAYLRPRYDGYLQFQDEAGSFVHHYLVAGGDSRVVLDQMEELRERSRRS